MRCAVPSLVASVVLCARVGGAQELHALTALPASDPAYAQLAALDRAGCAPARVSPHRPFLVRDVERAVARFAGNASCGGRIATALATRFTAPPRDSLPSNLAPDLAAAARESVDDTPRLRIGAKLTLRGTALARGEFEPLWAGVRSRDEGTPPVVADARARGFLGVPDEIL